MNRTLINLVLSMILHESLPNSLWSEALMTAEYVRNRLTSHALLSDLTSHHIWNGHAPSLEYMRKFGCACWYSFPRQNLKKLDSRTNPAMFIGYSEKIKAYKLLYLHQKKVMTSRDVIFDEERFPVLTWNSGPSAQFKVVGSEREPTFEPTRT